MSSVWKEILDEFDLWMSDGCAFKKYGILVAENILPLKDGWFSCSVIAPEGISSSCIARDFMRFHDDRPSHEATMIWNVEWSQPLPEVKYMICGVDVCPDNILADFEVPKSAIPLPLLQASVMPVNVIELFSGGLGGWKTACNFLHEQENVAFKVLAVEIDIEAAFTYAVSHSVPLISGKTHLDPALAQQHSHLVVHADVAGDTWLSLGSAWCPDIVAISSPCPPWSSAGSSSGLYSEEGQLLIRSIAICKLLRPRAIALEQVSAFASHEHFHYVVQTLRWAGYQLYHAQVLDASDILPIARSRWLAIALRVNDDGVSHMPFQGWYPVEAQVPNTWDVILQEQFLHDARLYPKSDVLSLSARHDLLPPAKRRVVSKEHVLASRCYDGTIKIPTLMASYGSQHCLSDAWLSEKGLMNHFFRQVGKNPRYWHPVELWLMHGAHGQQFFMKDWVKAYRHVGNQICTPHALLIITNILNCLDKVPQGFDASEVIQDFISSRNKASEIAVTETQAGFLAHNAHKILSDEQKRHIENFQSGLYDGTIPHDVFWNLNGFQSCNAIILDDTVDLALTAPMPIFEKVTICTAGLTFEVFIQDGIPCEMALQLWDHAFQDLECFEKQDAVAKVWVPTDNWQESHDATPNLWVVIHEKCLYVAKPSEETVSWFLEKGNGIYVDTLGNPMNLPGFAGALTTAGFSLKSMPFVPCNIARFVLANQFCSMQVINEQHKFQVTAIIQGPWEHRVIVAEFWANLFSKNALDAIGVSLTCNHQSNCTALIWTVQDARCPLPVQSLLIAMFSKAGYCLFSKLQDLTGRHIRIKVFGNVIWEGKLPIKFSVATLKQCLHAITCLVSGNLQYRMIQGGKQPAPESTIEQLAQDNPSSRLTCHFVLQMNGGGSENGTKAGHRTQIKNAIAGVLLEEGYDLAWTSKSVDQMMTKIGTKELSKFLQVETSKKVFAAMDFLRSCDIDIPKINTAKSSQVAANAKKKRFTSMPDPANYTVLDGVLVNENDSPCAHIPKFGGHQQGYHLCTPAVALPWLRQGDILSRDELALLIFGDLPVTTRLAHEHVTVPCQDEKGRQVLVAGVLVQCGDKKVKIVQGDGYKVDTDGTILAAVTWRKSDWPQQWTEICANPYKFLKSFPGVSDLLVSVWGKAYRQGKAQATANNANSVQVHCLFKEDKFAAFLKLSGFNMLWLSPKTKEGKPHPAWRILWLDSNLDMQAATALAAKIHDSAGLVCLSERYAIRVPKNSYAEAWAIIYPSIPVPLEMDTSRIFKLESLPFGVTSTMLTAWAEHISWPLKPLRAVGPRAWLIGTGQDPPSTQLHFNSSPILARELNSKPQAFNNPIVAGPRPSKPSHAAANQDNYQLIGDPWANWTGPRPTAPAAPIAASTTIGPTEQQFAQQADRLNKLETAMQEMQTGQKKQEIVMEKIQKEQVNRDQEVRQQIDDKFAAMKHEIDKTFQNALNMQASQFNANMEEIKGLLRERPKRKSKTEGDQDMSE